VNYPFASARSRVMAPLKRFWSSGLDVHCQNVWKPHPAGSVPGELL
jgi:hypothetical protein